MDENQCRLCCKNDNVAVCVFDTVQNKLCEKIYVCFGVQIKPDDPITKKICRCCYYYTNSVYEHRIASQKNDLKLKREHEEFINRNVVEKVITQSDFLNNFKLTNNIPVVHQSVERLKRNYPKLKIPECCNTMDLDPFVDVLNPKKRKKTWSISAKKAASNFVLTMTKTEEQNVTQSAVKTIKRRRRRRLSSSSSNSSNVSVKMTRSSLRSNTSDVNITSSDNENPDKPQFTCSKCDKSFIRLRNLNKHKCVKSSDISDVFKLPTIISSPLKKIANVSHLKKSNTDLKTLFEMNEKINDSISKLSKEKPKGSPESPQVLQENTKNSTTMKEPVEIPADTSVNEATPNPRNEPLNVSDLLVQGEEVKAFLCLTCNKIFDTLDLLKYHKRYTHKFSLRCDKCPKKFSVVEKLMKHKVVHDNFQRKREASAKAKADKASEANDSSSSNKEEEEEVNIQQRKSETIEPKSLSPATIKRAANLPQLSVSLEPLEYARIQDKSSRGRMVARKRTNGALFITKPVESHNISSDSDSSLSSSDEDDCRITEVFTETKVTEPCPNPALWTEKLLLDTALTPQSQIDLPIKSNSNDAVQDEIATKVEKKPPKNTESVYLSSEVFVIDSDSDTEVKKTSDQISNENKSTGNIAREIRLNSTSPILISANVEQASGSASSNTKITNEMNYINYLYNRCTLSEKSITNGSQYWRLQHLKKLIKNTIIPIEINPVIDSKVSIKYTATKTKSKPAVPLIPWNYTKAIDLNVGINNKTTKTKHTNQQIAKNNQQIAKNNQQIAKNHKASIKVPIAPSVKPKIINGPKSNQFTTKYVPSNEPATNGQNQKKVMSKIPNIQTKHYILSPDLHIQANSVPIQQIQQIQSIMQAQHIQKTQQIQQTPQIKETQQIKQTPEIKQTQQIKHQQIKQIQQIQKTQPIQSIQQTQTLQTQQTKQIQPIQSIQQTQTLQTPQTKQIQPIQSIQQMQQIQQTQEHALLQTQNTQNTQTTQTTQNIPNIPNKNVANASTQARSLLKNALSTSPQSIVYTYVPTNQMQTKYVTIPTTTTSTDANPNMDQSFVINGVQYQPMTNMNKSPTIVFQQIEQPNFINITQPTFFTTPDNGNTSIYLKSQTNVMQEKQTEITPVNIKGNGNEAVKTKEHEQMNEVSSSSLNQVDGHRPLIRIKNLSELIAKPSSEPSKEENTTYLNAYTNYVSTRNPL